MSGAQIWHEFIRRWAIYRQNQKLILPLETERERPQDLIAQFGLETAKKWGM